MEGLRTTLNVSLRISKYRRLFVSSRDVSERGKLPVGENLSMDGQVAGIRYAEEERNMVILTMMVHRQRK